MVDDQFERAALKYARRCYTAATSLETASSSLEVETLETLREWKGQFADDFSKSMKDNSEAIETCRSKLKLEAEEYAAAAAQSYNARKQLRAESTGSSFSSVPTPEPPFFSHPGGYI